MTGETNKNHILFALLLSVVAVVSCNRGLVYSDTHEMDNETWKTGDVVTFESYIDDTVSTNNIFFTIRTGTSYPYRNIWLFISTKSPSGKMIGDTLQYMLADEKGEWYGKGFGNIHELNLPFRSEVFFSEKGSYTFSIIQGMRNEELEGVYDFGIRIEKLKN